VSLDEVLGANLVGAVEAPGFEAADALLAGVCAIFLGLGLEPDFGSGLVALLLVLLTPSALDLIGDLGTALPLASGLAGTLTGLLLDLGGV